MAGMLLHIDGSKHGWFQNSQRYDLIVILDDATSEIYYAQLVEEESTRTVMAGLREVIEMKGLFCALYSDRGSHFFVTPKAGERVDKHRLTQVGRAMKELGVQMIPAYSPQARGRSERNFGTWQGRLPQELRLAGIGTLAEANRFLREHYIDVFNRKFTVTAEQKASAFRRASRSDLDWVFSVQTERMVGKDNTVRIGEQMWQIEKSRFRSTLAGCTSPFMNISMDGCRCATAHMSSGGSIRLATRSQTRRPQTRQKRNQPAAARKLKPPFPFPLRGKPGWAAPGKHRPWEPAQQSSW
jgi:hypothetical protein